MINRKGLLVFSILLLIAIIIFECFCTVNEKNAKKEENEQADSTIYSNLSYEKLLELKEKILFYQLEASQSAGHLAFENKWKLRVLLLIFLASIIGLTLTASDKINSFLKKSLPKLFYLIIAIACVFLYFDAQQGSLNKRAKKRLVKTAVTLNTLESLSFKELHEIQPLGKNKSSDNTGYWEDVWKHNCSRFQQMKTLDYWLFYAIVILLLIFIYRIFQGISISDGDS